MRVLTIITLLAAASSAAFGMGVADDNDSSTIAQTFDMGTNVNTNTSGYDPRLAMDALFYAKAASCPGEKLANWTCLSCGFTPSMREVDVFTLRETQAYVGFDAARNNIVISIRGSANIMNWIDNFTFERVPYPPCDVPANSTTGLGVAGWDGSGCKVHKGFFEIYKALSVRMVPAVKRLLAKYPSAALLVTGHSLGAAVATLSAISLHHETKARLVHVYHFGGPRVGDGDFARFAALTLPSQTRTNTGDGIQYRITHFMDPVPHVPLRSMGFVHTVKEIFYENHGNTSWVECNDTVIREDQKCANKYIIPVGFNDHMRYLGVYTGCGITADALAVRRYSPPAAFSLSGGLYSEE